jgi:hypothetical protein
MLRINSYNADFRPDVGGTDGGGTGGGDYVPVASLAADPGTGYAAAGVVFRNPDKRQACTLLARREAGYEDAWHLVTDLPPSGAEAAWYGLRAWVERGFRHAKGGGFHWDDTRMTDPARAARLWLAMAVASVLLLRQGGRQEQEREQEREQEQQQQQQHPRRRRILSVFCMGMLLVRVAALAGVPTRHARFAPEPWPCAGSPSPSPQCTTTPTMARPP